MMSALASTSIAIACAVVVTVLLGWFLGRLSSQFIATTSILSRLTEARGAVPTVILTPLLARALPLPAPWAIGLVVGAYQGIAVARWIRSRSGQWVPSLVGGIALGRSRAALAARRAARRGAVWVTVALCTVHVVLLEAVLSLVALVPGASHSIGGLLVNGGSGAAMAFAGLFVSFVAIDWAAGKLLGAAG